MHIYKSDQPIVDIPTDLNLTQLLNSSATDLPESHPVACDDLEDRSVTLGQLRDRAGRLAHGLKQKYHPRDQSRWAVILPNGLAYMETVHAILWLDGTFCPINHQLQSLEIAHALTVTKPEFVVIWSSLMPKLQESIKLAKETMPTFNAPEIITALGSHDNFPSLYQSCMSSQRLEIPHHNDTRKRLASIHLSSGTTGKSKGVGLSHYNFIANVFQCYKHDPEHWSPSNREIAVTPMAHIANTTLPLFLAPWCGLFNAIMKTFDVETYFKTVVKHKTTSMQLLPPLIAALLSGKSDGYDLSSVRYLVGGGGLKPEMMKKIQQLGRWNCVNLYGMTEAAPYVAWSKLSQMPAAGPVGPLLPGVEARLCNENGQDVKEGSEGELWLRGPNITKGYVDNASANATAFRGGDWYNTGDVCVINADGWLSVVGRTKELFKSSGFQVSPQELESYLSVHPDIQEVSVGPTYDAKKSTDVATAYVVLKPHITDNDAKLKSLQSIQGFLVGKVSGYKNLRGGVWEVIELQKNATGKILRHLIAARKTGLNSLGIEERAKL